MNPTHLFVIAALFFGLNACSQEGGFEGPPEKDAPSDASSTDVDAGEEDAVSEVGIDTFVEDSGTQDVSVAPSCDALCEPHKACDGNVHAQCLASCDQTEAGLCEQACVAEATHCEEAAACLGIAEGLATFSEGPFGISNRDVAGPFQLQTLDRPLDFETLWNGRESFVFLLKQTGWEYAESLWDSDIFGWLRDSPDNVHYVMMGYPHQDAGGQLVDDVAAVVADLKDRAEEKLQKIGLAYGKARECHWRRHLHFVPTAAWSVGGWIEEKLKAKGVLGFAIDRFQKIRSIGLLSMVNQSPVFGHSRYEPEHYNFEWQREQDLKKEGVTLVHLFEGEHIGGTTLDVELPSAEEMAVFDTFEIDLSSFCPDHEEENCGEWDTGASLSVKEHPLEEENAYSETACQGAVPSVEEVKGTCAGGEECVVDDDCEGDVICEGYVALVEGAPADTLPCTCVVPGAQTRESIQPCLNEGTGYGDCQCGQGVEVARWITTYGREGRWVSDHSQMLALLKNGGKHRFSYSPGNSYTTWLTFRFYTEGGKDRAFEILPLFGGGSFNPSYNNKYEPMEVDIPAEATRVELLATITGHGWGAEKANCAEFCNHTHHFTIGGTEYMHDQPWVGNNYGCAAQIFHGTVPNQYGTWTLGRAGWCPGLDVKPFVADVSESVTAGMAVTVTYKGLFQGADYQPEPSGAGKGFGANIWMNSWLVFYK